MTDLAKYNEDIYHCTRCGFCQSVCPVFDSVKSEMSVARGKIALLRAVLNGDLEFTPKIASYIELCTGCTACQEACPSGVCAEDIFLEAREYIANQYGLSFPKQAIVRAFSSEKALGFISSLLGMYSLSKAGFVADFAPEKLPFVNKIKLLNSQLNGKVRLKLDNVNITHTKPAYKLLYFPGCINKYVNPSVANASISIFEKNNCDVIVPEGLSCCGMPARISGAVETAAYLAVQNIDVMYKHIEDIDYVVVDCASCSSMLKKYGELFEKFPEYQEKAARIDEKIIDLNVFLTKLELKLPESKKDITVTYHDPCHLRRSQHVYEEPRHLIKGIKGVNFVEMKKPDTCCGAAGSFSITHQDVSESISNKKATDIKQTGSEIVLTSCPSCKVGLSQGLISIHKNDVEVQHIVELIHKLSL